MENDKNAMYRIVAALFESLDGANAALARVWSARHGDDVVTEDPSLGTTSHESPAPDRLVQVEWSHDALAHMSEPVDLLESVVGAVAPESVLVASQQGDVMARLGAQIQGAGFSADELAAMASAMTPGNAMLLALVEPRWGDDLAAIFGGSSPYVRSKTLTADLVHGMLGRGHRGLADAFVCAELGFDGVIGVYAEPPGGGPNVPPRPRPPLPRTMG